MNDRPTRLVGVSLKLYFDPTRTAEYSAAVAEIAARHRAVRSGAVGVFVLPSFPELKATIAALDGTRARTGAQDLSAEDRGAYTGEVSGTDLVTIGCDYVEVGHAERRRLFGETDEVVAAKTTAAVRNGLIPVLCVGEQVEGDPEAAAVECIRQLESALGGQEDGGAVPVVVAYEPVWAIGADHAAGPEHVRGVAARLRGWLDEHQSDRTTWVIYGGSARPGLFEQFEGAVDGLFLGRFAHDPAAFEQVLDEMAREAAQP